MTVVVFASSFAHTYNESVALADSFAGAHSLSSALAQGGVNDIFHTAMTATAFASSFRTPAMSRSPFQNRSLARTAFA